MDEFNLVMYLKKASRKKKLYPKEDYMTLSISKRDKARKQKVTIFKIQLKHDMFSGFTYHTKSY